jgi:hypothetical protein
VYWPPVALLVCLVAASSLKAQDHQGSSTSIACQFDEPDSVEISWNTPCETGAWLMDPQLGCRMWDWHPAPEDSVTWTGSCMNGLKAGHGVAQWFEHGRAIDRFEGTFVAGRRLGYGHYSWNSTEWYLGLYLDDRPHGLGTAQIAGDVFVGRWKNGCLKQGDRIVAINISRRGCEREQLLGAMKSNQGAKAARFGNR